MYYMNQFEIGGKILFESAFTPELINVNLTYKFQYHQSCKLSIEMLDTETDGQNSDDEKEDTARKYAS